MLTYKTAKKSDYPNIIDIWDKSVKATHHFLSKTDKDFYRFIIPNFLDSVELILWCENNKIIGFSGTNDKELVMLFLDPKFIGNHYGTKIINWLKENKNINAVDVNEQNKNALKFYLKQGFEIISRSEIDSFNKPYPILHLNFRNTQ